MFIYGKSKREPFIKPRPLTFKEKLQRFIMPKKLHDKLVKEANQKGLKGNRKDAYVYGTLKKVEKKK